MYYKMEKIENFRELGSLVTKDGRKVKDNTIFRCAGLFKASKNDIQRIKDFKINKIVDFRSIPEVNEKPDPKIEGIDNIYIPVNAENLDGVARDKKSEDRFYEKMIKNSANNPYSFYEYMIKNYRSLIVNEYSNQQYQKFIELLAQPDSTVCFHCTAGKDRTGLATMFILEILGVEKEKIYENYLLTNEYLVNEIEFCMNLAKEMLDSKTYSLIEIPLRKAQSADEAFLNSAYDAMIEISGSVENYLKERLGVTAELKKKIQDKYLCD